jgi:hypothetical protein
MRPSFALSAGGDSTSRSLLTGGFPCPRGSSVTYFTKIASEPVVGCFGSLLKEERIAAESVQAAQLQAQDSRTGAYKYERGAANRKALPAN